MKVQFTKKNVIAFLRKVSLGRESVLNFLESPRMNFEQDGVNFEFFLGNENNKNKVVECYGNLKDGVLTIAHKTWGKLIFDFDKDYISGVRPFPIKSPYDENGNRIFRDATLKEIIDDYNFPVLESDK